MDNTRVKVLTNEALKIRSDILQETDKDKKIELYEKLLEKSGDCFNEYDKLIIEATEVMDSLNGALHYLAKLSVMDPKECRRTLKRLYKS
jgi:hypothetical protein